MKIYGSCEYVEPEKGKEWYSLSVINKWNWMIETTCLEKLGNTIIPYCLVKNIGFGDGRSQGEIVKDITNEMKEELVNMGYELAKRLL